MSWPNATLSEARAAWPGAPDDDGELTAVLDAAYGMCEAFAPVAADVPTDVDMARFLRAQVMQARALYRSTISGSGDTIGGDGLTVTVFPMDWTIKALLRPPRKPVVG